MRILIAGAGGFIGKHLFHGLREEGVRVYGLTRSPAAPREGLMTCDLGSREAFENILGDIVPDVIIHAAGSLLGNDPSRAVDGYFNNLLSTANVVEGAIKKRVKRVIFLSSNMVYGDAYSVLEGQEEGARPKNWYARGKLLCEHLLRDHAQSIEVIVLRLPSVLGRGKTSGDFVTEMIQSLKERREIVIYGKGQARRQFLDTRDLTAVARLCASRDMAGRGFLLTPVVGSDIRTIKEIGESVLSLCGGGKLVFDAKRSDSPDQFIDSGILTAKLGCRLRMTLEDSIKEILRGESPSGVP